VHVARDCAGGRTLLTLTQDRFAIHDPHPAPLVWTIPVQIGAPGQAATDLLLTGGPVTARFNGCGMLKVNFGENGYYRTQYDAASLTLLRAGFATLGPADRANLLGDQFALFVAGRAPLADYLNLAAGLRDETDEAVWHDTIDHLTTLDDLLRGNAIRPAFQVFARGLLAPRLAALGWTPRPGERFVDSILRPRLIQALGELDDPGVTATATQMFAAFQKNPSSLPADLRTPVMTIVGLHADPATWQTLRRLGEAAPDTEEKMRYFDAMAAAPGPELLAANIAFATQGAIPNGRTLEFLQMGAENSADPNGFLAAVLPKIDPIIKLQGPLVDGYSMQSITRNASDPKLAAAILKDASVGRTSGARLDAKKAVDVMATNAGLQARAGTGVADWLKARS
jgi:aminopeptidase N